MTMAAKDTLFTLLRRALHPNPISPDLQFLRIQLEGIEFCVGFAQLLSEQRFIALFFLFQIIDAANPAFYDGWTLAAAVNQIHGSLLIFLCLLAHKRIEFRSHLFSLLFVVSYIEAVDYQRLVVLVGAIELLEEIFKQVIYKRSPLETEGSFFVPCGAL